MKFYIQLMFLTANVYCDRTKTKIYCIERTSLFPTHLSILVASKQRPCIVQSWPTFNHCIEYFSHVLRNVWKCFNTNRTWNLLSWLKMGKVSKGEYLLSSSEIYFSIHVGWQKYELVMKLFKLLLLITISTANVEGGFLVLKLLYTKQCNFFEVRLVFLREEKCNSDTWK